MQIATEDTQRLLAYISAVTRRGVTLAVKDLEAYAKSPHRRMSRTPAGIQELVRSMTLLSGKSEPLETWTEYLCRVGWASVEHEKIKLTPLGNVVLLELTTPTIEAAAEDATEIVLDPSDPLAYVRVIGALADIGDGILVDPYFRFDQLPTVIEHTQINRILTSKKIGAPDISQLELALAAFDEDQRPEIRIANELHDRFAISDDGTVIAIGTSLNSVGKNLSVVVPLASVAGAAIRSSHEDIWDNARIVDPKRPGITKKDTDSGDPGM